VPWTRTIHLTCPKCATGFDFEFIPGASLTGLRLGSSRYMRCPICRRFSVFPMHPAEASPPTLSQETPPTAR